VVAAPPPDDTSLLPEVNRACLAEGRAWLQLLPYDGRLVVVGPLFLPGSSACGTCFTLRRAACSGYEDDVALLEPLPLRARAPTPLLAVAAGLAATVAVRWLTAADPSLPGHLHVVEGGHPLGVSSHRVLRVPRCPDCGPFEQAVPAPWFAETA
jgi:bacteriocin biosynthesis cyclodehydratase domain-containing protein